MICREKIVKVWGWLLFCCIVLSGCNSQFYLSESEVAGYLANVRTADQANAYNLLGSLNGQTVRLDFQTVGGAPRLRRSNLLTVFRTVPNLYVLEQLFQQIRLDRLATQVEHSLEGWIVDNLFLLYRQTGARIDIRPLERVSLTFLAGPTVSYDPARQSIAFAIRVRLEIRGTLRVRRLDGAARTLLGWAITDGSYPIVATIDDFGITGDYTLRPGARLQARFVPHPGPVTIQGGLPSSMRDSARDLCRRKFGSQVHKAYPLIYDYFALSDLKINADGELDLNYLPRPAVSPPEVHVVSAGEDHTLYHTIGRGGHWQPYRALPFDDSYPYPVTLAASGANQLELMAVTESGAFSHATWRNGAWHDFHTSPSTAGSFAGAQPALVATSPGQLEVVLKGTDGRLYHVRRLNGRWKPPAQISIPPANNVSFPVHHPRVVQSGNKIILVFVDQAARPWVMLFDLETLLWGHPTQLQGPAVAYAPALASSGNGGRAYLVCVAPDGTVSARLLIAPARNITPRLSRGPMVGTLTDLGGHLTAAPTLTCSGFGQLQLVGRGTNHRLWHNQFRNEFTSNYGHINGRQVPSGWQGWQEITHQFFGTLFGTVVDNMGVGLAATAQGGVHLVARNGGRSRRLVYNSFDSARYARDPWKTVHWRGLHAMPARRFTGGPAIAILDRHLQLLSRNTSGSLILGPLADAHVARFAPVPNSIHPLRPDPALLSSVSQTRDVLFVGLSGLIEHERRFNGARRWRFVLPGPGNTAFETPVSAVSLGPGDIDAVAVGRNQILYHWRFLNGQWQSPVSVSSQVGSPPALVNVGAGRMELYAVKTDQRVHRWRFVGGQWQDKGTINTAFRVSYLHFGPMAVSSWGEGIVDLALVDDVSGTLYHRRIFTADTLTIHDTSRPVGPMQAVGTIAGRDPLLMARGPDDLHLLMTGADRRLYASQTRLPTVSDRAAGGRQPGGFFARLFGMSAGRYSGQESIRWGEFQAMSGKQQLLLGPGARLGDGTLAVSATAANGQIYLMRHLGHRWSKVMPLVDQRPVDFQTGPLSRPALVSSHN